MVAILVKSVKSDSGLVIGQIPKTAHPEVEEENRLIEQVWQRNTLLKAKRSNFTPAEYRIKLQGEYALEHLIKNHERRICVLVLKYQQTDGSASEDLRQEAIAAFVEAIASFDPSFGTTLYTHAYWLIRDRLQMATGRDIRNRIASAKALFEPETFASPEISDCYEVDRLNEAIDQLSEKEQQVICSDPQS